MKTPLILSTCLTLVLGAASTAQGALLLYEGFDYKPGELTGKGSVGYGMTGTWFGQIGPLPYHAGQTYRVLQGATSAGNGPYGEHWDGVLTHLPRTGLYAGTSHTGTTSTNRDWGDHTYGDRKIDPTITGLMAANITMWMSCATVYIGHQNHYKPMIALGAGKLSGSPPNLPAGAQDRGRHATGECVGMGAIHNDEGIRAIYWHDLDKDPNQLHERLPLTWQPAEVITGRATPQVMVAKFEWNVTVGGKTFERITVARFDDNTPLTIANWNLAKKSVIETAVDLDQSKFDTISFSGSRYYLDEIRLGTSFDVVVSGTHVRDFAADTGTIDIKSGGEQRMVLQAGAAHANRGYQVFGSISGTNPGVNFLGVHIPLNPDLFTTLAYSATNTPVFARYRGTLDSNGHAEASFVVPANQPIPIGLKVQHAYVVYDTSSGAFYTASAPLEVEFK